MNKLTTAVLGLSLMAGTLAFAAAPQADSGKMSDQKTTSNAKTKKHVKKTAKKTAATTPAAAPSK